MICTSVRWAESSSRKNNRSAFELSHKSKDKRMLLSDNDDKRQLFENCRLKAKRVVNPIIDWTDEDVWGYIEAERIKINPLYCEGQKRVGCIGCPMAGKRGRELQFARWPKYKTIYVKSFDRMLDMRREKGLPTQWKTGQDVFNWWMEYDALPGQISIDDILSEE